MPPAIPARFNAIDSVIGIARGGSGDPDELSDMECLFHRRLQSLGMRWTSAWSGSGTPRHLFL